MVSFEACSAWISKLTLSINVPRAGSGVVKIDPLRFLDGYHKGD